MRVEFDKKRKEYEALKLTLEELVKEREALGKAVVAEKDSVNQYMIEINKFNEEAKEQMLDHQGRFKEAIGAISSLSSDDLNELIAPEIPHSDVLHVMNAVMILIDKPKSWKSV